MKNTQPQISHIYLKACLPTPVLNRPEFVQVFGPQKISWDHVGIRALEFIALPGTSFEIVGSSEERNGRIYQVVTKDYPSKSKLFIDAAFCEPAMESLPRKRHCPSKETIISRMAGMVGLPYVWGGNVHRGVVEMEKLYPMPANLTDAERELWLMRGVDCSGMIYDATDGYTPRNTSELVNFGTGIDIEGKSILQIIEVVKPLDAVVWNGHVFSVLDKQTTIESRSDRGSIKMPIKERFEELLQKRRPTNDYQSCVDKSQHFVIRRWCH